MKGDHMSTFHIQTSIQNGFDRLVGYIPQIIGALVILLIGHIIAKIVQRLTRRLLIKLHFDRSLHVSPAGKYIARFVESPAQLAGRIAYWVIFFLSLNLASSALNIPALNNIVTGIYSYVPKVIAALLIFVLASAITAGAEQFVRRVLGNGPTARLIGAVIPAITMSVAIFMILNQLEIAKDIVNITYTAIMGALALGLALAFGLGGRDLAGRLLDQAYTASQRQQNMMPPSLEAGTSTGRTRGR